MARLLLDENMPRAVEAALAIDGHEVMWVADIEPSASDLRVLALARDSLRVLISFDSDFGELVFRHEVQPPRAIVYLRLHPVAEEAVVALIRDALAADCDGYFVVASKEGIRRRPFRAAADPAR